MNKMWYHSNLRTDKFPWLFPCMLIISNIFCWPYHSGPTEVEDCGLPPPNMAATKTCEQGNPDSKVHGANMGPIWALSAPGGPHVGPMNLAIREGLV